MLPGPDIILACPRCDQAVRYATFATVSNLGATQWSDGKVVAPMWPERVTITRCPACREIFWLEDARELGKMDLYWNRKKAAAAPSRWQDALHLTRLDAKGLVEAIAVTSPERPDRIKHLRVGLWHTLNDPSRDIADDAAPAPQWESRDLFLRNLDALLPLLNEDESNERLMKAEALREMGRFEEAMRILMRIKEEDEPYARRMRALAMRRDARVVKLGPGGVRLTH